MPEVLIQLSDRDEPGRSEAARAASATDVMASPGTH